MRKTEEFDALARALASAGSPLGPAELHGGLCGMLSVAGRAGGNLWLDHCLRDIDCAPETMTELRMLLEPLRESTWLELTGAEMEFAPLVPRDDEVLADRVAALAAWCSGFVAGLGLGGLSLEEGSDEDGDDVREIVADLVEISKAGLDASDVPAEADDGAEAAFEEIAEFVRVGAQLVFETLTSAARPADRPIVH